jgi:hypothetical protein
MAATTYIREFNGVAPGTPTDKTSGTVRFKNADNATVDLNNPIVRPGSGTVYSYEKVLRLRIGATGPTGAITSPRAFSDSANGFGTGVGMGAGGNGTYVQPINTVSSRAPQSPGFFSYTSGAPLALDVTNAGPFTGTNVDIADFLYLQASVASTASPGLTPVEVLTISYDET